MSKCIGFCHEQSKVKDQNESALHYHINFGVRTFLYVRTLVRNQTRKTNAKDADGGRDLFLDRSGVSRASCVWVMV